MAYIPDDAIDRMSELSAGAWRLYCFLARLRNKETGKCCPSVNLTMESIGINRGTVYALRKELQAKSWAVFDGNSATYLFGFKSPKNQTTGKSGKSDSPKIQTTIDGDKELRPIPSTNLSEKSDSPEDQTLDVDTQALSESLKIQTALKESENSDSPIGRTNLLITTAYAGANAPPAEPQDPPQQDARKIIWQKGVSLLRESGASDSNARSLLGKLAGEYGTEILARAIETVEGANPVSSREYLIKVLENIKKGVKGNDYAEKLKRCAERDLERFRTDWKAKFRAARDRRREMGQGGTA